MTALPTAVAVTPAPTKSNDCTLVVSGVPSSETVIAEPAPEKPERPENPDKPENPEPPENPLSPENPDRPKPENPENPDIPEPE